MRSLERNTVFERRRSPWQGRRSSRLPLGSPSEPTLPPRALRRLCSLVRCRLQNVSKTAAELGGLARNHADNLYLASFLVQQLLPSMCKGSSIVFVSSLAARASVATLSAYGATKGAVATLVTHFASALGERGIRVNAVAPGVVETDMSNFAKTESGRNLTLDMQALKRVAQPDDIGGVVAFLASDEARWITGDTVRVDGGSKL